MRLHKLPQTETYETALYPWGEASVVEIHQDKQIILREYYVRQGLLQSSIQLKNGRRHGWSLEYHYGSARLEFSSHYQNGLQDGPAIQYDEEGKIIAISQFVEGTGPDLWFCEQPATGSYFLSEESYYVHGKLHGPERNYEQPGLLVEENYYHLGKKHGLHRSWNPDGRLSKSCPHLYYQDHLIAFQADDAICQQFGFAFNPLENARTRPIRKIPSATVFFPLAAATS